MSVSYGESNWHTCVKKLQKPQCALHEVVRVEMTGRRRPNTHATIDGCAASSAVIFMVLLMPACIEVPVSTKDRMAQLGPRVYMDWARKLIDGEVMN